MISSIELVFSAMAQTLVQCIGSILVGLYFGRHAKRYLTLDSRGGRWSGNQIPIDMARTKKPKVQIKRQRKGPLLTSGPFSFADHQIAILVDDLHHTSSAGLNKNRTVVHVGVPVTRHMVLGRHLIIGDTLLG